MVTSDAISPSYCEQQEYTNACQQTVEDSKRVIAGFKNSGIEAYRHTLQQADVEAHPVGGKNGEGEISGHVRWWSLDPSSAIGG